MSNPIITGATDHYKIRSSAWLEHYTDNVGVTSSNLVGSTNKLAEFSKSTYKWGVSSVG